MQARTFTVLSPTRPTPGAPRPRPPPARKKMYPLRTCRISRNAMTDDTQAATNRRQTGHRRTFYIPRSCSSRWYTSTSSSVDSAD